MKRGEEIKRKEVDVKDEKVGKVKKKRYRIKDVKGKGD